MAGDRVQPVIPTHVVGIDAKPRIILGSGESALSAFLHAQGIEHRVSALATVEPELRDIVVLPTAMLTSGAHESFLSRCPGRVRIVAHGPTMYGEWASLRALLSDSLVASLGVSPSVDPLAWTATIRKLVTNDIFGLVKYFGPSAAFEHVGVRRISTRDRLLDRLRTFFGAASLGSRVIDSLVGAVDELVLRAFVSAGGAGGDAELAFGREVRVTAGMDADHIGIAVSDRCSRRYRADLAGAIASAFSRRSFDEVEQEIAVVVAARASTHIVVNVGTDGTTEFLCLIARTAGRRSRSLAEAPRSFGLFSEEQDEVANGW